jgi:hypothetical protein
LYHYPIIRSIQNLKDKFPYIDVYNERISKHVDRGIPWTEELATTWERKVRVKKEPEIKCPKPRGRPRGSVTKTKEQKKAEENEEERERLMDNLARLDIPQEELERKLTDAKIMSLKKLEQMVECSKPKEQDCAPGMDLICTCTVDEYGELEFCEFCGNTLTAEQLQEKTNEHNRKQFPSVEEIEASIKRSSYHKDVVLSNLRIGP